MKDNEDSTAPIFDPTNGSKAVAGLTKRELIAAMTMQGMLANSSLIDILEKSGMPPAEHHEFIAEAAIEQTDELLKQLEK